MVEFKDKPDRKTSEDNISYGNNKKLKLVDELAGVINRKMNMGADLNVDDLKFLSEQYMELKKKGVDVSGLDTKINSIKKNYSINEKMKEKGKVPLEERLGKEKEA